MATKNPFEQFDSPATPKKPNPFEAFDGQTKPSSAARYLADTGLSLGQGVVQGAQMLTNVAGADNAASKALGSASKALATLQSPYRKAEQANRARLVSEAEQSGSLVNEIGANLGAFAEAPIDTAVNALGTSAPTLAAAMLTGGASLPAQVAARVLPGVMGGAQGVGAVKGSIYEAVGNQALPGETPEQTEARAAAAQAYDSPNASQIALGGALGVLAGTTGIESVAGRLTGRAATKAAAPVAPATITDVAKAAGVGALKEAPLEGLQGGQERVAGNIALQNEGIDTPTFQGAVGQGVLEAAASAPLGAGFGAAERLAQRPAAPGQPPAPPAPAAPPPPPFVNPPSLTGTNAADLLAGQGGGLMGSTDPLRAVVRPSQAMGIDPSAGPLSRVAAAAVDSGVTDQTAMDEARANAIQAEDAAGQADQDAAADPDAPLVAAIAAYNEDMQGMASPSMVSSRFGITVQRAAELLTKALAQPATPAVDDLFPRPATGAQDERNADAPAAVDSGTGGPVGADAPGGARDAGRADEAPAGRLGGGAAEPDAATAEDRPAPAAGRDGPAALNAADEQDPAPQARAEAPAPAAAPVEAPAAARGDGAAAPGVPDQGGADAAAPAVSPDTSADVRQRPPTSADVRERPDAPAAGITKAELDAIEVPDMTDDQLRAGLTLYGAVTRRANKIRKEIQKRGLEPKSPAPQPQEPRNEAQQEADARPDESDEARQEAGEEGVLSDGAQAPETQQATSEGREQAPALLSDQVSDQAPAADEPAPDTRTAPPNATARYNSLVEQWNDVVRRYKAADAQEKAIIQPAMDTINAEMEAARREMLMDVKRDVAAAGKREQEKRQDEYKALPVGARLRPSEFDAAKGIFWEKTGDNEWTARGEWFQKGKTRSNAELAESGGLAAMSAAESAAAPKGDSVASVFTGQSDPKNSAPLQELDGFKVGDKVSIPSRTFGSGTIQVLFTRKSAMPMNLARVVRADGKKLDVLTSELQRADAPAAPDGEVNPLTQARNDLIEVNTRIEQQGQVVDDRLMERQRQLKAVIKELEGEQQPESAEPQRERAVSVPPTVDAALTRQMEKQKNRLARMKRDADQPGMTLEEKTGAQTKVKAAEATLRQMRLKRFDAEDAALRAIEVGSVEPFAEYADLFSDAADAVAALIPQAAPAAAEQPAQEFAQGPVEQLPYTPAAQVKYTEPRRDGKPFTNADDRGVPPAPAATAPDALSEREKAAKAKMFNALGKLAALASKNTRMNWTPEEEQQLLPIVIELFDGAMELGAVKFKQAVAYVRDFIAKGIDSETADAIPFETLQGAYIAVAGRHKDKPVTPKREVAGFESLDELNASLETPEQPADTAPEEPTNGTSSLDRPSPSALAGAPADDVQASGQGEPAANPAGGSGAGDAGADGQSDGAGVRPGSGVGNDAGTVPVPAGGTRRQRGSRAKRGAAGDAAEPGQPSLLGDDGRGNRGGESTGAVEPPAFQPTDFTIEEDFALGEGGQKTKYKNNVAAIRLLKVLDAEQRHATQDEQAILARYVGWGGISQAFDGENADWKREFAELRELLTDEEYAAASRSTRYAHYTSREIITGMYDAMKRLGFTGGKVLEPGAGVGNFMGLMPADLRSSSRMTGVERERIAGGIAKYLYPNQNMQMRDFTEFQALDGYFDAVIGNPPFAADPLVDSSGRKYLSGFAVHDYFFAKSIDMLREGGVFAAVVSNGFMDKAGDKARRYIGERAKLLGAIRLPNNAFAKNANTEVTTDIVFLQKLPESEWSSKAARQDLKRWMDVTTIPDPLGGADIRVNQYFADNPEMMLGQYGRFGAMYGPDQPALVARAGQDTAALLRAAIERLPSDVYVAPAVLGTEKVLGDAIVALRDNTVREGGYYVDEGKLYQRMPDRAGETSARLLTPETQRTEKTKLGEKKYQRLIELANMRRTLRSLLAAEIADDPAMEGLRTTLNQQYDAYVGENGPINDAGTSQLIDDDPDFPLLAALETDYVRGMGLAAAKSAGIKPFKSTAKKAPIFSQRVIQRRQAVTKAETAEDALNISLAERGRIDAGYIGSLLGRPADEALAELTKGTKPMLFVDPVTGDHVLRDAYLSGNVRKKLEQARAAGMEGNVRALMAVQPEDVGAHEISARIGAPWVPTEVYQDFIKSLLGDGTKAVVGYMPLNSSFMVSIKPGSEAANTVTYGTPVMNADAIIAALLNNRTIKVTYRDQDGKTILDKEATDAANEKASDIKQKFQDWLFADADRSEVLVRAYNDNNNNYVTRIFDGSMMQFPGKTPDIKFRRHQRNAIARIVQDRTALLDHVVGAGKTFTVIAGAMELKRTGLARKPLIVVPNHLVKQWAADFYRLYPGANILTATKKDFERANRRRFLAKIATGDWDAVVMAHSSFGFIQPDPDFEIEFNQKQIAHIVKAIQLADEQDDEKAAKRTVKQLEAMKERLENRIKSLRDKPVDALLDFKQIGVDQLFVDEAHLFKNLMFSTKMQNVQGLGDAKGSQRAYDMYVKVSQLYEQNGRGQGVVFATGTPVSNTLAEMYHMMRYLMPAALDEQGFESFDAWANTFASVDQVWMQKPSGDGYKASDRMGSFNNTPELLKMFDQVADTVTMDDIKKAFSEENNGEEFPLPRLKNDRRTPVSLDKSEAQNDYMKEIAERAKVLEQRKGPPQKGEDNFLTIMSDARKVAMDVRLVDVNVTQREPGGRIDRASDEVVARYRKYDDRKGTQLVFSDLGTPLGSAKKELSEYQELADRIKAGTSEDVVASAALGDENAIGLVNDAEDAQADLDAKGPDWLDAIKAAMRGFSVYDDFKAALIEKGIPENEIAFIHDYNTDDQKAALFRKVKAGQIRVLMGSTPKLGAGTNVQDRLVALHHLDVPWKPSDVEQREGRIIRQGNLFSTKPTEKNPNPLYDPDFEVEILAYVTKDTLDMRMWQTQEVKLKMINQLRTRQISREIENPFEQAEMSAGEMQAAATGNLDLLREIQLRTDVKKLEGRKRSFDAQRNDLASRKKRAASFIAELPKRITALEAMAGPAEAYRQALQDRAFSATINGKPFNDRGEAGAEMRRLVDEHEQALAEVAAKIKEARESAGQEFPEGSGERAAAMLDAADAAAKANPKPKLAVEFNGKTYGSKTALGQAMTDFAGDRDPIEWQFGGETFIHRAKLAEAIKGMVQDSAITDTVKSVGTIGGFEVTIEAQSGRMGRAFFEVLVTVNGESESAEVPFDREVVTKDGAGAANAIILAAERSINALGSRLEYAKLDLQAARKTAADLSKVDMPDTWPDQPKLDKAREEHRAILQRLANGGAVPQAESAAAGSTNLRQTGNPAANEADLVFSVTRSIIDAGTGPTDTEAHGPATQAHRDRVARVRASTNERLRAGGGRPVVLDAVTPPDGPAGRTARAVASIAQSLFGREVIFVRFTGAPLFNGMVSNTFPGKVFLNIDSPTPLMAVLGHELLHQMARTNPGLYRNLATRLARVIKDANIYGDVMRLKYRQLGIDPSNVDFMEELEADVVGDNFMDPEFWKLVSEGQPGLFRRITDVILRWLDMVIEKVGLQRPFNTDRFLSDMREARAAVADAVRQFSAAEVGAVAERDGDQMSVADAGQTDTPAFRRWFGDSKVVDEQGRPLVVYHGTARDFTDFDPKRAGSKTDSGGWGSGIYFAADPEYAGIYAGRTDGANIVPVYVALQNPLVIDARERTAAIRGMGLEVPRGDPTPAWSQQFANAVAQRGYDGVLVTLDGAPAEIVAFRPEQIKSATGNRGTFDPANPDIRFSIADVTAAARNAALPAGYIVNDFLKTSGKVSFWSKTVGTMYDLAQRQPLFRPVFESAQKFLSDVSFYASEAANLAPTILPKLETLRDITKAPLAAADSKAIATPIFEGTLTWARGADGKPARMVDLEAAAAKLTTEQKAQELLRKRMLDPKILLMWQGLPLDQYNANVESRYASQVLKGGIVFTPAELKSMFGLNDKQVGLYQEFRAATDKSITDMAKADIVRFGGADLAPVKNVILESATLEEAADTARKYLLSLAEADPSRDKVLSSAAAKIVNKAEAARDLIDRGYAPLSRFGRYSVDVVAKDGERLYFGLFETSREAQKMVRQMRENYPDATVASGTMSEEAYKLFSGVTPETLELFGEMLGLESTGNEAKDRAFQDYLKLAKNQRSAMKRLIHRKGIAGFSEDPGRVLAGFIYSNARQTAGSLNLGDLKGAINNLREVKGQGELTDIAMKLGDYVSNPQEEAQAIRSVLFAQYLGGSVASAMLNALQPVQVTLPYLSQFGGPMRAAGRLKRAIQDVLTRAKLDDGLAAALKRAEEEGIVSPQEVFQLQAQAAGRATLSGGDGTRLGDAAAAGNNALSRVMLVWGKLFGAAEQFNRRVTYIAAYRTATEQRMNDPAGFAKRAVDETQFIYNKGNRPQWARGAVGATLFTFKQYSISYVELMTRLARSGPEGRKAALLGIGVLVLMSGLGGLPFIEDLDDVIDGFMQRVMGRNFSSKQARQEFFADLLGEGGADFVLRGVTGLPGSPVDVSGRLGLGNMIPGTGIFQKKESYGRDLLEIAGPAGDMAKRTAEAAALAAQGEVFGQRGALATISPVAARNLLIAHDMAMTGSYQDQQGRKVIDTTPGEAAFKAIGFQPSSVDRVQDASFIAQRMISLNKIREGEIADKWARGVYLNDPAMVQDARSALEAWNQANPESPIRINMRQIFQRVKNMRMDKTERLAKTAPKEIREQVRTQLEQGR